MTNLGKDTLDYDGFFNAVWQLVDTWCETTDKDEYCQMLERLIRGVTKLSTDEAGDTTGKLEWKNDHEIDYDPFFVSRISCRRYAYPKLTK